MTSNRLIDGWIPLLDDPIRAQSALDRLAHTTYLAAASQKGTSAASSIGTPT